MAEARRPRVWLGVWALALTVLTGCGGSSDEALPPGDIPPRQGSIRIVNAIPDAPLVTAVLSGSPVAQLEFGQASPLAKYLVAKYRLGLLYVSPAGDVVDVETIDPVELTQEDEFNFLLVGDWATPQLVRIDNIEIDFGVDPKKDPSVLTEASVQVVHGATGYGAVDVYLTELNADLTAATPIANNIVFGNVSPLAKIAAPKTNYQLRVTPHGSKTPVFDSGEFAIAGFTRLLFLVQDYFGPGAHPLRAAVITTAGASQFPKETWETSLRFEKFIADAPAVDVYLDDFTGPPVFTNVLFGEQTAPPRALVAPGTHKVKITATGTTTPLVADSSVTLAAGTYATLFAGGRDSNNTAAVVAAVDDLRPIAEEARLRIENGSVTAGAVGVYVLPPGQPITDATPAILSLGVDSLQSVSLLPGSYDVTVVRSGTKVSIVGPERISVALNGQYTLVVTDAAGGGGPVELRPLDDLAP